LKDIVKTKKESAVADSFFLIKIMALKIFETSTQFDADVKVYETNVKSDADLVVHEAGSSFDGNNDGTAWYYVHVSSDADKKVYKVSSRFDADVVVCFTNVSFEAEWRDASKKTFFN
jgi:hypothetical protein